MLNFIKLHCILKDFHKRKLVPFFCLTMYMFTFLHYSSSGRPQKSDLDILVASMNDTSGIYCHVIVEY